MKTLATGIALIIAMLFTAYHPTQVRATGNMFLEAALGKGILTEAHYNRALVDAEAALFNDLAVAVGSVERVGGSFNLGTSDPEE